MVVRNFWLDAYIDGRKTPLTSGPRSADGGCIITLYQRNRGSAVGVLKIFCTEENGALTTTCELPDGSTYTVETTR